MSELEQRLLELGWPKELVTSFLKSRFTGLTFDSNSIDYNQPQYYDQHSVPVTIVPQSHTFKIGGR